MPIGIKSELVKPVMVLLHPINADGLPTTQQYIQQLSGQDLNGAREYLEKPRSNIVISQLIFILI